MSKSNGIRHIFFGLIAGKTKHHALISSANGIQFAVTHPVLLGFQCLINAHSNICGLFIQSHNNTAGGTVKTILSLVITDVFYRLPNQFLNVHIGIGCDLSHYQHKSCGGAGFTSHTAHWVLGHQSIQHRVGNCIAHFIWMAFCYGF